MTTENNLSGDKPKTGKGNGRGGARPNSGRKPLPPELKKVPFCVRVRPCDFERVKAFCKSLDAPKNKI